MRILRIAIIILITLSISTTSCQQQKNTFNSNNAFEDLRYQTSLGPRTPYSDAHDQIITWAIAEFSSAGWETESQEVVWAGHSIQNLIAKKGTGNPWIIIGAHYDSRLSADHDPDPNLRRSPVPGANDGASGVAILVELSRALPDVLEKTIWLVLFDGEDNGGIDGWDWILGSQAFVANLTNQPDAAVIIDMVGDKELNIYQERNSDVQLIEEIWTTAAELGYAQFIPEYKYQILDDHVPFLLAGIPAVDIIDFDYPYWHTTQDTIDKVSEESLDAVGETLLAWLLH